MGSTGFFIAGLFILSFVAAGVAFYRSQRKGESDTARLFAPRVRRLACVERTSLDGGRKLLLVRRDNVEHLILVGGPVDLVVESGIQAKAMAAFPLKDEEARVSEGAWAFESGPDLDAVTASKPQPSFFPKIKDEEASPVHTSRSGIKAAE